MTNRYTAPTSGGSGPMAPARPRGMEPRQGIQRVVAKAPKPPAVASPQSLPEPQYAVDMSEPDIQDTDELSRDYMDEAAIDAADREIEQRSGNGANLPQGCCFCGRDESQDVLVEMQSGAMSSLAVCGTCVEQLMEKMRAELPRRRMRLALEQLGSREVTPELLEIVESLSTSQIATKAERRSDD